MAGTAIVSGDSRMSPYHEGARARVEWLSRSDGIDEERARRYAAYRYRDSIFGRDGWPAKLEEFLAGWDGRTGRSDVTAGWDGRTGRSDSSVLSSTPDRSIYYHSVSWQRWRCRLVVAAAAVILLVVAVWIF